MRALADRRPKVVMVTSALPQEGKSVFAAGLARNAAAAGLRVILIECDFSYPSLAAQFRLQPTPGLCELLSGDFTGRTKRRDPRSWSRGCISFWQAPRGATHRSYSHQIG